MVEIEQIKKVLNEEKENFIKLGIERVGIFGSYVRGEEKSGSDIDLLIDISPDSSLTLFNLIDIEQKLSEKLNNKIDLVVSSDLKPYIREQVYSEVLYVS